MPLLQQKKVLVAGFSATPHTHTRMCCCVYQMKGLLSVIQADYSLMKQLETLQVRRNPNTGGFTCCVPLNQGQTGTLKNKHTHTHTRIWRAPLLEPNPCEPWSELLVEKDIDISMGPFVVVDKLSMPLTLLTNHRINPIKSTNKFNDSNQLYKQSQNHSIHRSVHPSIHPSIHPKLI